MIPPNNGASPAPWHEALSALFDGGLERMMRTLVHQAHYAGADRIAIRLDTEGDLTTIDWQHNGRGYATPDELAKHGLAAWPLPMAYLPRSSGTSWTVKASGRYVSSSTCHGHPGRHGAAWSHVIPPYDQPEAEPSATQGLRVRCATHADLALVKTITEIAVQDTKLLVTVNDETLSTGDHPARYGAKASRPWRGVDIAVIRRTIVPSCTYDLVIEGLAIDAELPRTQEHDGPIWITRADATGCPELSIDLAEAADTATRTRFLRELRTEATRRLYQAIAAHSANHPMQIDHAVHRDAQTMGIHIPLHPLTLRRWAVKGGNKRHSVAESHSYLMRDTTLEPHHRAALQHAVEYTDADLHLYVPDERLQGRPEYDALPSITAVHTEIGDAGNIIDLAVLEAPPRTHVEHSVIESGLCDHIRMHLISDEAEDPSLVLDTDITLSATEPVELDDLDVVRTRGSDSTPAELTTLLYNAAYDPYTHDESQNETLFVKCRHRAVALLDDEHRAHAMTIEQLVRSRILGWLPAELNARIDIVDGEITVAVTPRRSHSDQ